MTKFFLDLSIARRKNELNDCFTFICQFINFCCKSFARVFGVIDYPAFAGSTLLVTWFPFMGINTVRLRIDIMRNAHDLNVFGPNSFCYRKELFEFEGF